MQPESNKPKGNSRMKPDGPRDMVVFSTGETDLARARAKAEKLVLSLKLKKT